MERSKYGVHRTHCCVKHGCKYGDEDCPVVSGEIKQDYDCEDCADDPRGTVEIRVSKEELTQIIAALQYRRDTDYLSNEGLLCRLEGVEVR